MFGKMKLYVVTFDRRTQFIVEARNKAEAREEGIRKSKLKRKRAHWYTTNEITSVVSLGMDFIFHDRFVDSTYLWKENSQFE